MEKGHDREIAHSPPGWASVIAALGLALLEPLYNESRRRFSSGDSVMCSAFGREPLLRSLLKLKPRERSLGLAAFTA